MLLGDMPAEKFLADYWQQKPLLIRNALPAFIDPLSADELAGLAMEEHIESRLVCVDAQSGARNLREGPFTVTELQALDEKNWTLLVQAVDHWVAEVANLREQCSFLPQWRLDDVMVSYATPGGGVGPHFDQYDVFLLQGKGSRVWRIGPTCDASTQQIDIGGLKSIEEFTPLEEHTLYSGDVLYLPPAIAHWGIAQTECLTYSIGFRAPSHAELLGEWSHAIASTLTDRLRYTDSAQRPANNSGFIDSTVIDRLQHILQHYVDDRDALTEWFGAWITEPKYPELAPEPVAISEKALQANMCHYTHLQRSLSSRIALSQLHSGWVLFFDGAMIPVAEASVELARSIAEHRLIEVTDLTAYCEHDDNRQLLSHLLASGSIALIDAQERDR